MRKIYLLTKFRRKAEEWKVFVESHHGVRVVMVDWDVARRANHSEVLKLLEDDSDGSPIAVCDEVSTLVEPGTEERAPLDVNLLQVEHLSRILCYQRDSEGKLQISTFEARTDGYIDTSRGQLEASGWWDEIFVVASTGETYGERAVREGVKISSRTLALSEMVNDLLLDDDLLNLRFDAPDFKRPVDFSVSYGKWLMESPLLLNTRVRETGLSGLLTAAVRRGNYFRTRQKWDGRNGNYFLASLAGHPIVPKSSKEWEAKFAMHDAGHSLIWRPLPDEEITERQRQILITTPMVDESLWLAIGEFAFVDSMVESGGLSEDDASKFQGWAAYREMGWAGESLTEDRLRSLLYANTRFFTMGDTSAFANLGVNTQGEAFRAYTEWFTSFSVQDWRWNARNSLFLRANVERFVVWWELIRPINEKWSLGLTSLAEFDAQIGDGDLCDEIFEHLYETAIRPNYRVTLEVDDDVLQVHRAFCRWSINQLGLVAEHWSHPEARRLGMSFRDAVLHMAVPNSVEELLLGIDRLREFFEQRILDLLVSKRLIGADDRRLMAEIYPLFPRFSISYGTPDATIQDTSRVYLGSQGAGQSIGDVRPGVVTIIANRSRSKFILERKDDLHPLESCRGCLSLFGGSRRTPDEVAEVALRRELSEELCEAVSFVNHAMSILEHFGDYRLPLNQYGDGDFDCEVFTVEIADDCFDRFAGELLENNDDETMRPEGEAVVLTREELLEEVSETNNFVCSLDRVLKDFLAV
jgi:8-oxo-dGTP pyrophosphatase MutT (NUDIX family)